MEFPTRSALLKLWIVRSGRIVSASERVVTEDICIKWADPRMDLWAVIRIVPFSVDLQSVLEGRFRGDKN